MILPLHLWKVEKVVTTLLKLLIIVSKAKYELDHYSIKKYFSNHKKKKSKEHFHDYTFLFYFYSRQVIEDLSRIYWWK